MINTYLDLACLKPTASKKDVIDTCVLGREHNVASVCVLPHHVDLAKLYFKNVSTVIGFPFGCSSVKYEETKFALHDGAKELDVVLNYSLLKDGIFEDLKPLVYYANDHNVLVKLILETCFHSELELITLCEEYDYVDMLKTSSGIFGGAEEEKVKILLKNSNLPIKASGGIKTKEQAEKFIDMGCKRLGASRVF